MRFGTRKADERTDHEDGGFFAGLENPRALVGDLKEIRTFWTG